MTRYISDQNKVVLLHESGTYAVTSGVGKWIGEVVDNNIVDAENKIIERYMGTARRDYDSCIPGPRDVTGTIIYHPIDMRIPFWAIGSVVDSGTSTNLAFHTVNEVNSDVWQNAYVSGTGKLTTPPSFTIEDSKIAPGTGRNFIRTVKGVIPDSVRLILSQGEKARVECDYIGQTLYHSSGNTTTIGSSIAERPYVWSDAVLTVGGSIVDTAKEITFEIDNNLEAPHYVNGSRDVANPYLGNKDYILTVNMDFNSTTADYFYSGLFKGNTTFNSILELDMDNGNAISGHTIFFLSGCKLTNFEVPSKAEGTQEAVMEIRPRIVIGSSFDMTTKYNPW